MYIIQAVSVSVSRPLNKCIRLKRKHESWMYSVTLRLSFSRFYVKQLKGIENIIRIEDHY